MVFGIKGDDGILARDSGAHGVLRKAGALAGPERVGWLYGIKNCSHCGELWERRQTEGGALGAVRILERWMTGMLNHDKPTRIVGLGGRVRRAAGAAFVAEAYQREASYVVVGVASGSTMSMRSPPSDRNCAEMRPPWA